MLLKPLFEDSDRIIPSRGLSVQIVEKLILGLNIFSFSNFKFKPIQIALWVCEVDEGDISDIADTEEAFEGFLVLVWLKVVDPI